MTDQLNQEFKAWKAEQPVYQAPKAAPKAQNVEVIDLEVLKEQFTTLQGKGLSEYNTFDEYLNWMLSQEEYDMDIVNGKEVLTYTELK